MKTGFIHTRLSPLIFICIIGVLLSLPSLWTGFLFDDFIYLTVIDGKKLQGDPSANLFSFVSGDVDENRALANRGYLPWWTDDRLKIVFWRPLSELLTRIDHALFGNFAWAYHFHSLVWWIGLSIFAALLLRRTLPGPVGVLAFLIFVLDECHMLPVAWIANRNALVAVVPAFFGLWAHLKWREDNWRAGRYLSVIGFAVGLLGGETALCVLAYLLTYEVWGVSGSKRRRLWALAPAAGLLAVYITANRLLGGGVSGSGIYIDPVNEPIEFLVALPSRLLTLLSGGILGISANLWILYPAFRPVLVLIGGAGFILLPVLLRSAWSTLNAANRKGIKWLLPGSVLALVPVAASFPSDRLLLPAVLGLSGALAVVLLHAWRSRRLWRRWHLVGVGVLLVVMHLLLVPLSRIYLQTTLVTLNRTTFELTRSIAPGLPEPESPEVIVLTAPDHVVGIYLPVILIHYERFPISGWRTLSLAPYDHRIVRTAPRTVVLEVIDGAMMGSFFELLYRKPRNRLRPGDVFERGILRAEVLETSSVGPTRVAFRFDRALNDPSLRFLVWEEGGLRPATLPEVGDTLVLPRTLGPAGF